MIEDCDSLMIMVIVLQTMIVNHQAITAEVKNPL